MFEYYSYDSRDYAAETERNWEMIEQSAIEEGLGKIPKKRIVCPQCNGDGKYVNPNIDRHGLSYDDLDDEQWEMYRTGGYDVTCGYCNGKNVVDEYDESAASPEMKKHVDSWWKEILDSRADMLAELRAGC